jgi:Flp pilus assembly protein TadD
LFISAVGLLRYRGEFFTRKMYDAKKNNLNYEIIKAGALAKSFAYSLDPTSLPVEWYTGNAHAIAGNYKNAEADLLKAYKLNPYNRNVVNDLASAYSVNGKTDLAKKYYIESSRISPRFDDAKLNLTAIYINEKNYKLAGACLDSIFHDSPRRTQYTTIVNALK